ncbi:hypothetical protein [Microbispora sp. H11081]|uniref:hypothetical protein n=1 Tax=Microbispora sp. H11081 TaxID=2729107 RepID=UPI001475F3E6|nr:hypothetical protein [Microbispora sp. H11081]
MTSPQENLPPYDSGWKVETPGAGRSAAWRFTPLSFACAAYALFSSALLPVWTYGTSARGFASMFLVALVIVVVVAPFIADRRRQEPQPGMTAVIAFLIAVPQFFFVLNPGIVETPLLRLSIQLLLGLAGTLLGIVGFRKGDHLGVVAALASAAVSVNLILLYIMIIHF